MDMETNQPTVPALISLNGTPRVPEITHIHSDKLIIGRGYEATLKILEKAISRKHCTLEKVPSFGWTISSHSRNVIEVNNAFLLFEQSKPIKCGDRIGFPGVCVLVFKCAPDRFKKCCCDRIQEDIEVIELSPELDQDTNLPTPSELPNQGSSVSTSIESVIIQCPKSSADMASTLPSFSEEENFTSSSPLLKLSNLQERLQKYLDMANTSRTVDEKSIQVLKEYMKYIDELLEYNRTSHENVMNSSEKHSLPTIKRLLGFCKTNYQNIDTCKLPEDSDQELKDIFLRVNLLLTEQMRLFMYSMPDLFENLFPLNDSTSRDENKEKEPIVEPVSETDTEKKSDDPDGQLKDELKHLKQNSDWQDARIRYLEMKLKERDKLEKELETAREENDGLEAQLCEMRLKLSKQEVMELELSYLKESSKYKEDDKRSKDELEKQIELLKKNLRETKTEIEKISMVKSALENDNTSLKQKCEEIEKKLNTKVGCTSNPITGEYCCDLFSSLKDNILESLEKEFTCCICNEMFIGATVTNCNHVFCAFCLKEWKKKKKQCPFCRANLTSEHRANVVDECITNLVKLISEKLYSERIQMIEDRKTTATPPPAKRARRGRAVGGVHPHAQMQVPIAVRNHAYATHSPFFHQNLVLDLMNLG